MRTPPIRKPGYGWEKLFTEQLCRYYQQDYRFETRIVRFHNVYGPLGHLRRRQGEGSGRDLPQGGLGLRTVVTSKSGATACRLVPSCSSTIVSRASYG